MDAGHKVGNHTYSHQKGWGMSLERYIEDVDFANDLIHSELFRPPYARITPAQARALSQRYKLVMWDVLSRDYSRSLSPRKCLKNVTKHLEPGAIVVSTTAKNRSGTCVMPCPARWTRSGSWGSNAKPSNCNSMKIVVAVTAASGALYARLCLEQLLRAEEVSEIALVYSAHAREVADFEGVTLPEDPRIRIFDNDDLFAPPASGSADYDAMAVVPCSVGTLGRIACGVSQSLIERAADVMLKERRRLVLVVRETPLSLIHLRNMTALTEAGAVVLPASPGFYARPSSVEELCRSVAERVTALLGISGPLYRWTGEGRSAGRNDSDSEK